MNNYILKYQTTIFNDRDIHYYELGSDRSVLKNKLIMFIKNHDVKISKSNVIYVNNGKQMELLTSFELQLLMINYD